MGSLVTDADLQSPVEVAVTDVGVHSHVHVHGEQGSEPTLCLSQYMEPSYETVYQELHKAEFHRIRSLVQTPKIGTFMHTDLMWASHMRVKGRRADPRIADTVSVAYIPWARVDDFVKGEEARTDAPCKFICQGSPTNGKGKLMFPRWNNYSAILRCVCNMQKALQCACSNVTTSSYVTTLLYMTLTENTCCPPHSTGIIVSMGQRTIHRTYHWLQTTCTTRKKSSTRRANLFQVGKGTQVHGHQHTCEDSANEGDANVDLSSSNCTYNLQWQKLHTTR